MGGDRRLLVRDRCEPVSRNYGTTLLREQASLRLALLSAIHYHTFYFVLLQIPCKCLQLQIDGMRASRRILFVNSGPRTCDIRYNFLGEIQETLFSKVYYFCAAFVVLELRLEVHASE